jgi:hypothetical protein
MYKINNLNAGKLIPDASVPSRPTELREPVAKAPSPYSYTK